MYLTRVQTLAALCTFALLAGCASEGRHLMPTPEIYQTAGSAAVVDDRADPRHDPDLDLFFITDRAVEDSPESDLPYGEGRGDRIAFGSARVRLVPPIGWEELQIQSRLAQRTREVDLDLGVVHEITAFPKEPYHVERLPSGHLVRDADQLARHEAAERAFQNELQRRIARSPGKDVVLYIHGFNETFASAAYTAAELCHFLGREDVCGFFTWPASASGNFLISYTSTTESATYAVGHLKKTIRMIASTPGVERIQLLAHSRGTAVTLDAVHDLVLEVIAAGKDPADRLKLDNLVLFSPDIDVDIASQRITDYFSDPDLITAWPERHLPKSINGRMTLYTSPADRALLVSKLLFRSRSRVGSLTADQLTPKAQAYLKKIGKIDIITYGGGRTDIFGHSYFTGSPQVSSDLIEMIRYGKKLGEPAHRIRLATGAGRGPSRSGGGMGFTPMAAGPRTAMRLFIACRLCTLRDGWAGLGGRPPAVRGGDCQERQRRAGSRDCRFLAAGCPARIGPGRPVRPGRACARRREALSDGASGSGFLQGSGAGPHRWPWIG